MNKAFITFVTKEDEELIYLHYNALMRIDKASQVIYVSDDKVKVPKGAINLNEVKLENGKEGLITLISLFKFIEANYKVDFFICSTVTTILKADCWTNNLTLFFAWMNNYNCSICQSFYFFHALLLDRLKEKLKTYYDLFGRKPTETFLYLLNAVTNDNEKMILQMVANNRIDIYGSFFNSSFYSHIDKLAEVKVFVETESDRYLMPFAVAGIPPKIALKRAMRHVLHSVS